MGGVEVRADTERRTAREGTSMSSISLGGRMPAWLRRFSTRQLVVAATLIAVVIGGSVALVSWVSAPQYKVLFSGLAPADAGAVTAKLDADGVPYELDAGGATVLVPADQVDPTRIAMASASLPAKSTVGYELLDQQSITTDSFTQQVNYQRALEGELSRTLTSIDGVNAASVRIVMPKERLFTDEQAPARAAVLVTTNRALSDGNVGAITHLVSSSVPELDPTNVTVTDSTGRLLTSADLAGGTSGDQRKQQAAYERQLEEQATTMLSSVVGPGKAVVRVNATMDFTKRNRTSEVYDPKRSATKSSKTSRETYTSQNSGTGGQITSNAVTNAAPGGGGPSTYNKSTGEQSFNNSKTITTEAEAPGAVTKLTVSVLMDEQASGNLPPASAQSLVENAVGADAKRGDSVLVQRAPFDTSAQNAADAQTKALAAAAESEQTTKLISIGIVGLVLLIAVIGLLILLFKSRKTELAVEDVAAEADRAAASVPGEAGMPPAPLPLGAAGRADEAAAVLSSVDQRPADAANVLRGLMASDEVAKVGAGR